METFVSDKNPASPAHNALDPDSIQPEEETEAQATDRRLNSIANKAAEKGLNRQQDDTRDIFSK